MKMQKGCQVCRDGASMSGGTHRQARHVADLREWNAWRSAIAV